MATRRGDVLRAVRQRKVPFRMVTSSNRKGKPQGKTTEKAGLPISQNIIRNDEGCFSPSLTAPNSEEKIAPNNVARYRPVSGLSLSLFSELP